jgi:hypothetical protein
LQSSAVLEYRKLNDVPIFPLIEIPASLPK